MTSDEGEEVAIIKLISGYIDLILKSRKDAALKVSDEEESIGELSEEEYEFEDARVIGGGSAFMVYIVYLFLI